MARRPPASREAIEGFKVAKVGFGTLSNVASLLVACFRLH